MAVYTQIQEDEIEQLFQKEFGYARQKIKSCRPMKQGLRNSNYLVETEHGSKYMLRICDDQSIEQVGKQIKLLYFLRKSGFCTEVPPPLVPYYCSPEYSSPFKKDENREGHNTDDLEKVVLLKGKPVILTGYIEGETIAQLDAEQLEHIGMTMRSLHGFINKYNYLMHFKVAEFLSYQHPYGFQAYHEKIMKSDHPYVQWFLKKKDYFNQRENLPDNIEWGLVHGDLWADNVLFLDGKLRSFLDFESACILPRMFDIGMTIIGACRDEKDNFDGKRIRALLKGYGHEYSIPEHEKRLIQPYTAYAAAVISIWRFYHFNIQNEERQNARHQEAVDLCERIESIPKERFIEEFIK